MPRVIFDFQLPPELDITAVVVVPKTVSVILDQVKSRKVVGSLEIDFPLASADVADAAEYDEDEQLYQAMAAEANRRKYPKKSISVFLLRENSPVLGVIVPHFANPIVERVVADAISAKLTKVGSWIVLSPCLLNNGISVCRLDLGSPLFTSVPTVQPPHFISGIGAAVISSLRSRDLLLNAGSLVLNAEGHPGFEKVDAESIMQAAAIVAPYLVEEKDVKKFLAGLSLEVRRLNSAVTSGMYI